MKKKKLKDFFIMMLFIQSGTDGNIESQQDKVSNYWDKKKQQVYQIFLKSTLNKICVSLIILTLTLLTYLVLYGELSKLTMAAQTVTVSSEGQAAEMYPDSMGQYTVLREVYRYDRPVYKHVDREDRFIIYTGRTPGLYSQVL